MVDNDSAEVMLSGRSFHVREPTTGKALSALYIGVFLCNKFICYTSDRNVRL